MDRRSPFFLVLVIILFGIAVAGALWVFGQKNIQLRRDTIISGIQHIAADAFQYRLKPSTLGGGGGSFARYAIPPGLGRNQLAAYAVGAGSAADTLFILAVGADRIGTITARVDSTGGLTILTLTGDLAY